MRLTRASFYALHALAHMAEQEDNRPIASHAIAKKCNIGAERFLLKVLKPLVTARILVSIKGPHGGYRLAKSPNNITMLEVVEAAEQARISGQVPIDPDSKYPELQDRLTNICDNAAEQIRKQFKKIKLSDLVGKKGRT